MKIEQEFPLRFWINLGRRDDRRMETEARMLEAGMTAERFAAVDSKWIGRFGKNSIDSASSKNCKHTTLKHLVSNGDVRGYESEGRYALALTQRLAIREAKRRGAPSVLLMEDDIVFHPNFKSLIQTIELPDDWGIFYFGCAHAARPKWVGTRIVRCGFAVDTHAVAIRSSYFQEVINALDRFGKPDEGVAKASDQFLALLHSKIPAYACFPNLMWQDVSQSDLIKSTYSNYTRDGRQKCWGGAVARLLESALEEEVDTESPTEPDQLLPEEAGELLIRSTSSRVPRLGLLFLTRGDVNHPEIWREFVAEVPQQVRVISHPKFPEKVRNGFLADTMIQNRLSTEWGKVSLVRASRAMLLAALEDRSLTHFVLLSESCVPIRPLSEILKRLKLDPRPQFDFSTLEEASFKQVSRVGSMPEIPPGCWRFTSQWWLFDRTCAILAAGQDYTHLFETMFASDEAYFATMLSIQGYPLEGEVVKKDVTWTSWEDNAGSPTEWHSLPIDKLEELVQSGAMFARKFPKGADIGKFGLHRTLEFKDIISASG